MHERLPLLDQALRYLTATKNQWPRVSAQSGVPYSTITKVFQRVIRDPRISTVQRLLDHRDGPLSLAGNCPLSDSTGRTVTHSSEIRLAETGKNPQKGETPLTMGGSASLYSRESAA